MRKVRKTRLERQHQRTGTSLAADAAGDDASRSHVSSTDSLPGVSVGGVRQDTGVCSDSGGPSPARSADSVPPREVPRIVQDSPLDGNSQGGVVNGPTHTVSVLPNLEHQSVNSRHCTDVLDGEPGQPRLSRLPAASGASEKMTRRRNGSSAASLPSIAESSQDVQPVPDWSRAPDLVEQRRVPMVDIKALTRDQLPSDPHMYWRLSEEERMLLTLMSSAYEDTVLVSLLERQGSVTLEAAPTPSSTSWPTVTLRCVTPSTSPRGWRTFSSWTSTTGSPASGPPSARPWPSATGSSTWPRETRG